MLEDVELCNELPVSDPEETIEVMLPNGLGFEGWSFWPLGALLLGMPRGVAEAYTPCDCCSGMVVKYCENVF